MNPISLENPVLRRELMERLRSSKTMAALLVVAVLSSLIVWLRWPTVAHVNAADAANESVSVSQLLTQGSMDVFGPLAYGLMAAIAALVPAFPATSIVRERKRGTLSMLLHSPLTRTQLYLGKLLGTCGIATILVSTSLPAIAAAYTLGGLSIWSHLLPLVVLLLVVIFSLSTLGLYISSVATNVDTALRLSYGAMLGLFVLTLVPSLLWAQSSGLQGWIVQGIRACSPISALQEIVGQAAVGGEGLLRTGGWFLPCIVANLVIGAIASYATLRNLRPDMLDRSRDSGKITDDQSRSVKFLRRIAFLVDPQRRKSGIPAWANPVMVKEFRTRKFGRMHWLIRLVAVCAIGSLGLTAITATGTVAWGTDRIVAAMVVLQLALLLVLGPSLGAGLISGELESGGWVQLRTTPMSTFRIVLGKLMSVLWTLGLILLATLPGYAAMAYIQPALADQLIRVTISLVISAFMILSLSACVSAFHKQTATATAVSYGLLLAILAGTFLVWVARDQPFGRDVVRTALLFNPAAAALAEMRVAGMESYDLLPTAWWIALAIAFAGLVLLGVRTWRLSRPS
jgi:ABC-type transport system involved in multi-copper enzyme maturation permease subunit